MNIITLLASSFDFNISLSAFWGGLASVAHNSSFSISIPKLKNAPRMDLALTEGKHAFFTLLDQLPECIFCTPALFGFVRLPIARMYFLYSSIAWFCEITVVAIGVLGFEGIL